MSISMSSYSSEHSSFAEAKEFLSRLRYNTISLVVEETKAIADKLIQDLTGRRPEQQSITNLFFKRKA